jgi:hypothetical protein
MENKHYKYILGTLLIFWIVTISYFFSANHNMKTPTPEHKIDSLNLVIDSLQTEIFYLEDGFDHKEHIYEQAIYDCEHKKRHRETLQRLNNE